MKQQTLLNLNEVKQKLGINDLPLCDISNVFKVEYKMFKDFLGADFYKHLKDNLTDISAATQWNVGSYELNDMVVFEGIVHKANKQTDTRPSNKDDWDLVDKFKTDCLNNLWCMFLCEALSWSVLRDRMPLLRVSISSAGITIIDKDNEKSLPTSDLRTLLKHVDEQITSCLEIMHDYMVENESSGCYDLYIGIANSCCEKCGYEECKCLPDKIKQRKKKHAWRIR